MSDYRYEGDELSLFREAHRWKAYLRAEIRREVRGAVLEVGAGMGGTTRAVRDATDPSWTCLEPDESLCDALRAEVSSLPSPEKIEVRVGTLATLPEALRYATILYVDIRAHRRRPRQLRAPPRAHARRLRGGARPRTRCLHALRHGRGTLPSLHARAARAHAAGTAMTRAVLDSGGITRVR
ncbi:MAG: class I SAM-dependent methyltransferase [Polyangiales bacterium]